MITWVGRTQSLSSHKILQSPVVARSNRNHAKTNKHQQYRNSWNQVNSPLATARSEVTSTSRTNQVRETYGQQSFAFLLRSGLQYRRLHTTPVHPSFIGRWLSKGSGMRRRIGAWADSLGVTSGHLNNAPRSGSHSPKDGQNGEDREGEELFVMPGWAVVKYREGVEAGQGGSSPSESYTGGRLRL